MYPLSQPEKYQFRGRLATVTEHLGYDSNSKLLIINADDLGFSPEVNAATAILIDNGRVTSSTIMVPGISYSEALASLGERQSFPCGVHLTLTSSAESGPSFPIADPKDVPTLLAEGGCFHPDRECFFKYAKSEEAEIEAIAQIEKALGDGIDVTHLDSHEGTLQLVPAFAEVFLYLAERYRLPVRMGSRLLLSQLGLNETWIAKIRGAGIHVADNLIYISLSQFGSFQEKFEFMLNLVEQLPAGLTEMFFHPALEKVSGAIHSNAEIWRVRYWDFQLLMSEAFSERLKRNGIILTDFRKLRALTRSV